MTLYTSATDNTNRRFLNRNAAQQENTPFLHGSAGNDGYFQNGDYSQNRSYSSGMVPVAASQTLAVPRSAELTNDQLMRKRMKTALVYLLISLFCVAFCAIYEQFSFGEHSDAMRLMFLVPLAGGTLPFLIKAMRPVQRSMSRPAYLWWNSGLAVWTSGCLVKGIIEVSGRVSDYDLFYLLVGGGFLLAALIKELLTRITERK